MDNPSSQLYVGVGLDISDDEIEKRNAFLSLLSAYPPASQAYTATATYESMACGKLVNKFGDNGSRYSMSCIITVQGQFEDAEATP